jgi:hypothetical protein
MPGFITEAKDWVSQVNMAVLLYEILTFMPHTRRGMTTSAGVMMPT